MPPKNHVMWILLVGCFYVPSAPVTVMNHISGSYNCGWVVNLVSFAFRRDFTVHDGHGSDALCCQLSISGLSDFLCGAGSVLFGMAASSFFLWEPCVWNSWQVSTESSLTPCCALLRTSSMLSNMLAKSSATRSCCALSFASSP